MNWLKKNNYITTFLVCSVIFVIYFLVMDDHIETYEQVEIEHGDTLWMLADHYSGKMDKKEWIAMVKKINYLYSDEIIAGQQLTVPVVADSQYFTLQTDESITVASDNQWKMQ